MNIFIAIYSDKFRSSSSIGNLSSRNHIHGRSFAGANRPTQELHQSPKARRFHQTERGGIFRNELGDKLVDPSITSSPFLRLANPPLPNHQRRIPDNGTSSVSAVDSADQVPPGIAGRPIFTNIEYKRKAAVNTRGPALSTSKVRPHYIPGPVLSQWLAKFDAAIMCRALSSQDAKTGFP